MKVSVAMCTYNGERFLQEQLESIAAQELPPDELVVCDDGSQDRTLEVLQKFSKASQMDIRLVRNAGNLGYKRNFMQAVGLCTGDVIALSDQDDVWYPKKLASLAGRLNADSGIGGVFCDGDLIDSASLPTGRTLWESFRFTPKDQAAFNAGKTEDTLIRRNVVTGMAFAFRSSYRQLLYTTPESWIHDGWLAFQIALRSRLVACPERLVGYRVHSEQQVGTPLSWRGKWRAIRDDGLATYTESLHRSNLDEYQRTASQFTDLASHLEGEHFADRLILKKIHAKAAHAQRGVLALSQGRSHRWGLLKHAASYAKLSPNGLRGLARDLVI